MAPRELDLFALGGVAALHSVGYAPDVRALLHSSHALPITKISALSPFNRLLRLKERDWLFRQVVF